MAAALAWRRGDCANWVRGGVDVFFVCLFAMAGVKRWRVESCSYLRSVNLGEW